MTRLLLQGRSSVAHRLGLAAVMAALATASSVMTGCDSPAKRITREGNRYYDDGDMDRALAKYEEALKVDPQYAQAHKKMASVYKKRGDYEKALSHYYEAIRLDPDDVKTCEKIVGAHINNFREGTRNPQDLAKGLALAGRLLDDPLAQRDPKLSDQFSQHARVIKKLQAAPNEDATTRTATREDQP